LRCVWSRLWSSQISDAASIPRRALSALPGERRIAGLLSDSISILLAPVTSGSAANENRSEMNVVDCIAVNTEVFRYE
jgi:hypothetical protein